MIGDNAMAGLVLAAGRNARQALAGRDQRAERVDIIIVMLALHHRRDTLKPHARVDAGLGQALARTICLLLELHKDEIPDLDEAIAILIRAARRPAGDICAVIVEYFAARPTRPRIAHRPEIVRGRDADDPIIRQARNLLPQIGRIIIIVVNRDQQLVLGQPPFTGQQCPGMCDRLFLEIIAEREIPEHFKERMMPRGIADIIKIIVLAACAYAFLAGCRPRDGPRLKPGKHVLERHHTSVRKHQCRVVVRHQRRRRDDIMARSPEIIEEGPADFIGRAHTKRR